MNNDIKITRDLVELYDTLDVDDYQGWAAIAVKVLRALPAAPVVESQEEKLDKPAMVGCTRFSNGVSSRLVIEAAQRNYEYQVTPEKEAERIAKGAAFLETLHTFASPPAPVAVAQHPFTDKVISKLQRFVECCEDGQGADIGRHWFDLLTQLGLLNRVQRSPALWEITQQGEDCLDKVKELNR